MKRTAIKRGKSRFEPHDTLCSKYVRLMSGGYCKRCWLMGRGVKVDWRTLHWSHCFNRNILATRWEYDNSAPLCCGCHRHLDLNHEEKREFFMEILGSKRYNEIREMAKPGGKPDRAKIKATLKERIKLLEDDN